MKSRQILIFSFIALIVVLVVALIYKPTDAEDVHFHAGFVVYIDDVKQDYSDYKYMNFVPCSEHSQKKTAKQEQIEKAHLHDGVGDVVHVHRDGAVWGDLFKNIGVTLPSDLPVLSEPIEPNSSIVITVGESVDKPEKVSLDHIKEVEAKSELCGSGK